MLGTVVKGGTIVRGNQHPERQMLSQKADTKYSIRKALSQQVCTIPTGKQYPKRRQLPWSALLLEAATGAGHVWTGIDMAISATGKKGESAIWSQGGKKKVVMQSFIEEIFWINRNHFLPDQTNIDR